MIVVQWVDNDMILASFVWSQLLTCNDFKLGQCSEMVINFDWSLIQCSTIDCNAWSATVRYDEHRHSNHDVSSKDDMLRISKLIHIAILYARWSEYHTDSRRFVSFLAIWIMKILSSRVVEIDIRDSYMHCIMHCQVWSQLLTVSISKVTGWA
jgi:hypothetical protein